MNRSLQWDIFCKVIDNHGDIGVCWRLSAELASRGHRVRLWVDDASALCWMAPEGCDGVTVLPWLEPLGMNILRLNAAPCEVLVEAFGCEIAPEFIAACADQISDTVQKPVWINLEYLSAEPYVERNHALPSPVQRGPAAGWTKWFFYPGFTPATGGLLREPTLLDRQAGFDRAAWLAERGIAWQGETLVSLFCYEPPALAGLLTQLAQHGLNGQPVRLLVADGRASHAVKAILNDQKWPQPRQDGRDQLSISYLPLLSQIDFDHLLWACELNFVRGEDSVVRALWAGQALVWQVYPQADQAHQVKLQAFLDRLDAPASLRRVHAAWNGLEDQVPALDPDAWSTWTDTARQHLLGQDDLCTQLIHFVAHHRQPTP
ncbi:elongation factor P maturation arginine rhamnosyltransferase EarP [Polaromonas sp. SM01]|uniref:elongation factor P maturation arginine rhamnosyltransferase EarP n=1 Tax=Polaromonas sp. SM01 TaxID=3085630 RepID=UPI002981D477|nr:elongation factor P maturation arginine rhamnosyltransferase EarP [Polaromonas sp. SM01]MDW5441990.1 elongation factor P maturation arginine rhamnosyltransferase EarP [Polaromonas sp. SM01]